MRLIGSPQLRAALSDQALFFDTLELVPDELVLRSFARAYYKLTHARITGEILASKNYHYEAKVSVPSTRFSPYGLQQAPFVKPTPSSDFSTPTPSLDDFCTPPADDRPFEFPSPPPVRNRNKSRFQNTPVAAARQIENSAPISTQHGHSAVQPKLSVYELLLWKNALEKPFIKKWRRVNKRKIPANQLKFITYSIYSSGFCYKEALESLRTRTRSVES